MLPAKKHVALKFETVMLVAGLQRVSTDGSSRSSTVGSVEAICPALNSRTVVAKALAASISAEAFMMLVIGWSTGRVCAI
jgi:hypothetical protein